MFMRAPVFCFVYLKFILILSLGMPSLVYSPHNQLDVEADYLYLAGTVPLLINIRLIGFFLRSC